MARSKVATRSPTPTARSIYVGKDLTTTLTYFGTAHSPLIEADFTPQERRDFTVTKVILWESDTATDDEVSREEVAWILRLRSNDPTIGYNRWPRFKPPSIKPAP